MGSCVDPVLAFTTVDLIAVFSTFEIRCVLRRGLKGGALGATVVATTTVDRIVVIGGVDNVVASVSLDFIPAATGDDIVGAS